MDVVRSMLEHHCLTTEEELCEFISTNYSEIPEHKLYPLVVGAVTGAQYAVSLFEIKENSSNVLLLNKSLSDKRLQMYSASL